MDWCSSGANLWTHPTIKTHQLTEIKGKKKNHGFRKGGAWFGVGPLWVDDHVCIPPPSPSQIPSLPRHHLHRLREQWQESLGRKHYEGKHQQSLFLCFHLFWSIKANFAHPFLWKLQNKDKDVISAALSATTSNTTASICLATISLTLCSLIGAWIANSSNNLFQISNIIYGDTRPSTISVKYISLLTCFLLAFSCFIQSARHFVHANYLISHPGNISPVKNVELAVIRGGELWVLGLRALHFALNLLLWFFGPIPMFVSSVLMVIILYHQDGNSPPLHQYGSAGSHVLIKRTGQDV